jgi:hypothetical protein
VEHCVILMTAGVKLSLDCQKMAIFLTKNVFVPLAWEVGSKS